jgi:hypothetical protein
MASIAVGRVLAGPEAEDKTMNALKLIGSKANQAIATFMDEKGFGLTETLQGGWSQGNVTPTYVRLPILDFATAVYRAAQSNSIYDIRPDVAIEEATLRLLPTVQTEKNKLTKQTRYSERKVNKAGREEIEAKKIITRAKEKVAKLGYDAADLLAGIPPLPQSKPEAKLQSTPPVSNSTPKENAKNAGLPISKNSNVGNLILLVDGEIVFEGLTRTESVATIVSKVQQFALKQTTADTEPEADTQDGIPDLTDPPAESDTEYFTRLEKRYGASGPATDDDTYLVKAECPNLGPTGTVSQTHMIYNIHVSNPILKVTNPVTFYREMGFTSDLQEKPVPITYGSVGFDEDNGLSVKDMAQMLAIEAESVAKMLLPNGRRIGSTWRVGSLAGERGQSLVIQLTGIHAGKWKDFARNQHGDLVDLWCCVRNQADTPAYRDIERYLTGKPTVVGFVQSDPPHSIRAPGNLIAGFKVQDRPVLMPDMGTVRKEVKKPTIVKAYLQQRGIAEDSIAVYKVGEKKNSTVGSIMVFPFFAPDSSDVFNVKYAPVKRNQDKSRKNSWFEKGCRLGLWGWHAIRNWAGDVVICEGEVDALTWHTLGCAALSVPNGATGYTLTQDDFFHLRNFKHVFVSLDMDEPGQIGTGRLIRQFEFSRLFTQKQIAPVRLPAKDINQCVADGFDAETLIELLRDLT